MKRDNLLVATAILALGVAVTGRALSAEDRLSARVPGGLAMSEFKGYDKWEVISVSHGDRLAVIVGNPTMIKAFKSGIPANGTHFPDGSKMAKIHWTGKKNDVPGNP